MNSALRSCPPVLAALGSLILSLAAAAQQPAATRVDDTGTVVGTPLVAMRWRQLVPGRGASNDIDGEVDVALRLNLAPWLNRDVALYLVLEPSGVPGTIVTARWRTGGRLLPGTVQSGGRVLVWRGRVGAPSMQEALHVALSVDGSRVPAPLALQFHIEAEAR